MLTELRVRDLAVIADVTLSLRPGLNVLTGETGAGKSILIDALALLLGERANVELVRPGADRAVVEAAFDVHGAPDIERVADESGVSIEDGRLVVRRDINSEGRNRAWANGSPSTVGVLGTLGEGLVDLHGQHETQSLLRPGTQRDILDAFGDAQAARDQVVRRFRELEALREKERALEARRDDVWKRADYLRHVVKEIEDIAPKVGEDDELAAESQRLTHAEDLTRLAEQLAESLDGEGEAAAGAVLAEAARTLGQLERFDASVPRWRESLEAARTAVQELARDVRAYGSEIEVDPARLEDVEARRDRIYRLLQKYGSTVQDVLATGTQAANELEVLDTADTDLARIADRRAEAERELIGAAATLTAAREHAGARLEDAVGVLLPALGLPEGRLAVQLVPAGQIASHGAESVRFQVQLNRGLEPRPLADVASGGELSRIMLALKVVLAEHDAVNTLVFDEVDQGIGGEIGAKVGDALEQVARTKQVLVITHLPQIAARASHHLRVTKGVEHGIATTEVAILRDTDRIEEIARLLGDPSDPRLRQHAQDLLQRTTVKPSKPLRRSRAVGSS